MKKAILVLAALLAGVSVWGINNAKYLEVRNETGFVITALYISSTDSEDWGDNRLNGKTLENKAMVQISLESLPETLVDIRARDGEGDTYTLYAVDASGGAVVFNLTDIDPD